MNYILMFLILLSDQMLFYLNCFLF